MFELTQSQKTAVEISGGELLVSAAAGAGKTMVMTERIAQRVAYGKADISSILVMTFTDAAARNMRDRISERFDRMLQDAQTAEERQHIARCIRKLPQAHISTIHSFCLEVIRSFYYEALGDDGEPVVEPGFRIEETGEADALLSMSVDDVLTENYELCDIDPENVKAGEFIRLVESYGGDKSDVSLRDMVREFVYFLRSIPDHDKWIDSSLKVLYDSAEDFCSSPYYRAIMDALDLRLVNASEGLESLEEFLDSGPVLKANAGDNENAISNWRNFVSAVKDLMLLRSDPESDWDDIREAFLSFPDIGRFSGGNPEDRIALKEIFCRYFAELVFMGTGRNGSKAYNDYFLYETSFVFYTDSMSVQKDIGFMYPVVKSFFDLTSEVILRYTSMKKELNMIDFADFEHIALMLLRKPVIRDYYTTRFREIYIDEYQDTSGIEDAVISLISSGNIFMVGDVKQSIYRFRHAKPEIFLSKMDDSDRPGDSMVPGRRRLIELNENFRSLGNVIKASNSVFSQIMTKDAGEIDYTDGHELVQGRKEIEETQDRVKVILADISRRNETEDDPESSAVALEIAKLIRSGEKPGDIAVLSRTGDVCRTFAETLEKAGLPVMIEKGEPSPDIYELRVLESMLNVLDNPRQDIHLAAVMRSPLFAGGFSEDELLKIRNSGDDSSVFFHECVTQYISEGSDPELKEKLSGFINEINDLRSLAVSVPPGDILDQIITESGLEAYASAMPDGKRRVSLLRRFTEWVRAFTQARHCGIHEAAVHLQELKEKGIKERPYSVEESMDDRIRIMTIHKSKGLQYRNVFVVGTAGRLKSSKGKNTLRYSAEGLPAVWMIEPELRYKYPTPTVFAHSETSLRKSLAEEMRLLYVAMTRAKDRLFISGRFDSEKTSEGKDIAVAIAKASDHMESYVLPFHVVLSARSMLDWLLMALAGNPNVDMTFAGGTTASVSDRMTSGTGDTWPDCWDIILYDGAGATGILNEAVSLMSAVSSETEGTERPDTNSGLPETGFDEDRFRARLTERFRNEYRYKEAAQTPLKLSVSEIKRKWVDEEEGPGGINLTVRKLERSDSGKLSGAAKGTAVHSFIRYAQFEPVPVLFTDQHVIEQIDAMDSEKMFTPGESDFLRSYSRHLCAYYNSTLAKMIKSAESRGKGRVFRETPFTLTIPCSDCTDPAGSDPGDFQLVQGMIDCWFIENGEAYLVDYKTDSITGSDEDITRYLKGKYGIQLKMYRDAIEKISNVKVARSVIWLFAMDKSYDI